MEALHDEEHISHTLRLVMSCMHENNEIIEALDDGFWTLEKVALQASFVVSHEVTNRNWGSAKLIASKVLELVDEMPD